MSAETQFLVKQDSKSQTVPPAVKPQVELLNAGNEPRQELRFQPQVNAKQTATMTMNMDMEASMAGQSSPTVMLPTMVVTINTVVTKIAPNGDINFKFSYSNADVVNAPNVPPQVLETMRSQIKKMAGTGGSFTIDSRGQYKAGNYVLPEKLDPNAKQIIEQMSSFLDQLSSPLPQEAIGEGAKWRVTSSPLVGGMSLTQTATYELVSLKDGITTLNVGVEQHANSQKLTLPQIPKGFTLTLKSFHSQGEGQAMVSLNQMLPLRSNIIMQLNSQMGIKQAGNAEEMTMDTKLRMKLNIQLTPHVA